MYLKGVRCPICGGINFVEVYEEGTNEYLYHMCKQCSQKVVVRNFGEQE